MNGKILKHLKTRPIAWIVSKPREIDDVNALKFICALDYMLEVNGLYPEIMNTPDLIVFLTNFHSFEAFKYIKYSLPKECKGKLLQCKYCKFFGPIAFVLDHILLNHNMHVSAKHCMWCEKLEYHEHLAENSFDDCYNKYLRQFESVEYPDVIKKFYKQLEKLAIELKVFSSRGKNFKNVLNCKRYEMLPGSSTDDMMSRNIVVYTAKRGIGKQMDVDALERCYHLAMMYFYQFEPIPYHQNVVNADESDQVALLQTPAPTPSPPPAPLLPPASTSFVQPEEFLLNQTSNIDEWDMVDAMSPKYGSREADSTSAFHSTKSPQQTAMPVYLPTPTYFPMHNITPTQSQPEDSVFAHCVVMWLGCIQNDEIKKQAKDEITKIIWKYCNEDVAGRTPRIYK